MRIRALIVEDSEDIAHLLKTCFEKAGFDAVAVHDGVSAMAEYWMALRDDKPFSVAILDIALPLMDGFEVARRIKTAEAAAKIDSRCKLIGYTGYGQHAREMATFEDVQFDCIWSKPDDAAQLPRLINALLDDAKNSEPESTEIQ